MSKLTTADIEWLIRVLHTASAFLARSNSRRRPYKWFDEYREISSQIVALLHHYRRPARRKYIDCVALVLALGDILQTVVERARVAEIVKPVAVNRWQDAERRNHRYQHRIAQLETCLKTLQQENEQLRLQATLRPRAITVDVPAEQITVQSEINQAVLGLMAQIGAARSWRIIEQVLALGKATHKGSVQNALTSLTREGLIEDFVWQGKQMGWRPPAGGGGRARRLVMLTERGQTWARSAYGQVPVHSELSVDFLRRHDSVAHAVGILEAAEHLRTAGYRVDADPAPLLAGDERWGRRSEPDLLVHRDGHRWPVEVQREVHERRTAQWAKTLKVEGRLLLILFNERRCSRQTAILQEARQRGELPAGEIYLASLESMERGDWQWIEL